MRIVAGIVGVLLLAFAAYSSIVAIGGLAQPAAVIAIVMAVAVAVGGWAIGAAVRHDRPLSAFAIGFALVVFEGAALISLSKEATVWREATDAARRGAQIKHEDAVRQRDAAQAALQAARVSPPVSSRQAAAQLALDAAVAAIRDEAGPGCRESCQRQLLSQAADARRDLEAAQTETVQTADASRRAAEDSLARAEEALTASPLPTASQSSAERFGIEPWLMDIIALVLTRLPANALGATALAFASHGRAQIPWHVLVPRVKPRDVTRSSAAPARAPGPPGAGRVTRFVGDYLEAAPAGRIEVGELFSAYRQWCRSSNLEPVDRAEFGNELPEALDAAGLRVKAYLDKVYVVGVTVRT